MQTRNIITTSSIGYFLILPLFIVMSCQQKRAAKENNILQISYLGYVADTNYLKSITDYTLPDGTSMSSNGYRNYTKKYLEMEIKNCSSDTVCLQGFEFSRFPIDTLLTKSITVIGVYNEASASFDSIARPDYVEDYYAYDNIVINPDQSVQKLVENKTDIDLVSKRLKLKVLFKIKRNDRLIPVEENIKTVVK